MDDFMMNTLDTMDAPYLAWKLWSFPQNYFAFNGLSCLMLVSMLMMQVTLILLTTF